MLFSKEDLRRLLMPLMLEQLLAVTIGMMGYHDGFHLRGSRSVGNLPGRLH